MLQQPSPAATISIVVPHYNDLENLAICLDLLGRQVVDDAFEIVVADNNSSCDRVALVEICDRPNTRLIDVVEQGAAPARNGGVEASRSPLLAFIDSDCRPEPGWLQAGIRALSRSTLVGGRVDVTVDDEDALTPTEAFERIFAFNNARYIRDERFSVTANMFTTRAVFDQVGGFRSGVSEDREWGQRAAVLGYTWLYEPAARMGHPARRTPDELHRKWRRLMRESFLLARERQGFPLTWLLRAWVVVLSLPLALLAARRSDQVRTLADRLNAMRVVVRLRFWRFVEAHRLVLAKTP
ncbi:glycosyltransferase [Lichenihabitans sp. Uapishka_5]|uniref:glycosyltransferase family 2 protein n=1 Tax=Lichenihabitans sp. Uapishka_5 TaxID=3037302 RepID=UPI0029E7D384|nr:glycosyltransferase [Lichenihabitans sp. Uapishka_5]MDX7952063.1 glycosyltransferase [Lichenihabitans sp. Uapishka_5]